MKIRKHLNHEVEVEIGLDDIRTALREVCEKATVQRVGSQRPSKEDVIEAITDIGTFLRAIPDYQLSSMTFGQLSTIGNFLAEQAKRFKKPLEKLEEVGDAKP